VSAMDVIEDARADISALLAEVICAVLDEKVVPGCAGTIDLGPCVRARLAVCDQVDGSAMLIELRMEIMVARFLAGHMMATSAPGVEDVLDAVGELGNMAAGNIKTLFPHSYRLSLPTVELMAEAPEHPADAVVVRAGVLGQPVELSVAPVADTTDLYWPGIDQDSALERQR
jgi:hypothetical protein